MSNHFPALKGGAWAPSNVSSCEDVGGQIDLERLEQVSLTRDRMLYCELSGFCSYHVKSYRILYIYNEPKRFLETYFVGHRRDVYKSFLSLLIEMDLE